MQKSFQRAFFCLFHNQNCVIGASLHVLASITVYNKCGVRNRSMNYLDYHTMQKLRSCIMKRSSLKDCIVR